MRLFEDDREPILIDDGTGIEPEEPADDEEIREPFDTGLIRVETKPSTIDLLLQRMRHDEIDLQPEFQRKGGIWKPAAQSRLIESLLIRIPLPAFYMDATDEEKWLVVDGLQRLTALKNFIIDKRMRLSGLEFLTQFHNKSYDDLPRNFQRRIAETQVTIYLIEKGTPPAVKFNIFKRINTGGLPLSTQEIRHALNQGRVTRYLARLANSSEFKHATHNSIRDDRMADRECVLRFLAFTISPYTKYRAKDLDGFLNENMATMNHMADHELESLAQQFFRALKASNSIFGKYAFRKPKRDYLSPINKTLFETWTVNLNKCDDIELELLTERRNDVRQHFANLMNDREFDKSITTSTGNVRTVRYRFASIENLIKEVLS
jgi:hypothetical protein